MQQTLKAIITGADGRGVRGLWRITGALWGMARPLQLVAIMLVTALGWLMAHADGHRLSATTLLWSLAAILLVAISVHYANEYADYETDALTTRTPFSGGSGVLAQGDIPRALALWGMGASFGLALAVCGLGLAVDALSMAGVLILLGIAFWGWMYSLPPLQLAWRGWGELDNALLGGLSLHVYGYAAITGQITLEVVAYALPFTLLVFLNLLATTWPDRHADAQVGKFTLATTWPVKRLRRLYGLVALMALLVLVGLYGWGLPTPVFAFSLGAVPLVTYAGMRYTEIETPIYSVGAMTALLILQLLGWLAVIGVV